VDIWKEIRGILVCSLPIVNFESSLLLKSNLKNTSLLDLDTKNDENIKILVGLKNSLMEGGNESNRLFPSFGPSHLVER
jgi:hypothetical protein